MTEAPKLLGSTSGRRETDGSECTHMFCPSSGLVAVAGMESTATGNLLRMLLRPVAAIMFTGSALFVGLGWLLETREVGWGSWGVVLLIAAATVLLFGRWAPSMAQLRGIEALLFGAAGAHILMIHHQRILAEAASENPAMVLSSWNVAGLSFVLLMAVYAIFVPNRWQRAALLVLPMALAPVGLGWLILARHPEVERLVAPHLTLASVSDVLLLLAVGIVVALTGTALITRFRTSAYDARRATLYEMREKIGTGGMGEVWLAEHQILARPAAIKLIRPEVLGHADGDAARRLVKRFEREAQATAALRSPNTVEVYDFGTTDDGVFYYVMEYLDGLDLETLVRRHGPLPPGRAVHLLLQTASSLADAHERGLVHRDVKPANIFVCRLGLEHDFVKVLDFGLVKDRLADEKGATQITVDGLTSGTPAFLPPEMALQDRPVSPQTDVYALGCVAYWLLTGKLVFEQETPMALVVDHVKTRPEPPSRRTEMEIPEELDRIVLRCLEKDPADRFAGMEELANALSAVDVGERWSRERARDWWNLHHPRKDERELARAS